MRRSEVRCTHRLADKGRAHHPHVLLAPSRVLEKHRAAGGVRDMSTLKGAVNLYELVRVEARPNGVEIVLEIAEGDRLLELRIADKAVCMQWVDALRKHVPDAGAPAGANGAAGGSAVTRAAPPAALVGAGGGQNEI